MRKIMQSLMKYPLKTICESSLDYLIYLVPVPALQFKSSTNLQEMFKNM